MELVVIVGSEQSVAAAARDRALDEALDGRPRTDAERIDVAADGGDALVAAVGAPSLFGPRRVIDCWGVEDLSAPNAARLVDLADSSDAVVVARAVRLGAAQRRKLPPHELVTASAPTERDLPSALSRYASARGVRLSADQAATLAARCRDHHRRAYGIIDQAAMVRVTRPSDRQIETLLGTTWSPPRPWEVTSLAEAGRLTDALAALDRAPEDFAFALLGMMRKTLCDTAVARTCARESLAATLGVSASRATQLSRRAQRVDPEQLRAALAAVCDAEFELRSSGVRHAAVDLALVAYTRCFAAAPTSA